MKKYILPAVLLAAGFSLSTIGFQKQEIKAAEEIGTEVEETSTEQVKISPTEGESDGMALYSSCPFIYEETEWELQTFVQEDMLIDGELAMDDSGHFLIQAISGEESYVFLDETIQLGVPEADVWVDDQNKMHIVIRDIRTARYRVTDFVFDSEEKTFIGTDVLSGEGINYIGTTGK